MIVNTNFNVRGEPIVCTPAEAYRCYQATEMDALVLEDCLIEKSVPGAGIDAESREKYLAEFQRD